MQEPLFIHKNFRYLRTKVGLSIPKLLEEINLDISSNTYASYEDSRENIPKYPTKKLLLDYYSEQFNRKITIEDLYEIDLEESDFFNSSIEKTKLTDNSISEKEILHLQIELAQANALIAKAEARKAEAEADKAKTELAILRNKK